MWKSLTSGHSKYCVNQLWSLVLETGLPKKWMRSLVSPLLTVLGCFEGWLAGRLPIQIWGTRTAFYPQIQESGWLSQQLGKKSPRNGFLSACHLASNENRALHSFSAFPHHSANTDCPYTNRNSCLLLPPLPACAGVLCLGALGDKGGQWVLSPSFVHCPCSSQAGDWSRMAGRGCRSPLSASGKSSSSSQSNCKALKGVKQKEASSSILSENITVIALCKMYWIWGKDLGGSPSEKW